MQTKERAQQLYNQPHFLLRCPYCGTELVVGSDELHDKYTPFEPQEQEYEYYEASGNKLEKKKGKQFVTSDRTKDVYKDIKCCYCGHVWNEPVLDIHKKHCEPDGDTNIVLKLNDTETERARVFMVKHDHSTDYKREGKTAFTALGQQYTYIVTPGRSGSLVSIKCNYCGESEDITDYDW